MAYHPTQHQDAQGRWEVYVTNSHGVGKTIDTIHSFPNRAYAVRAANYYVTNGSRRARVLDTKTGRVFYDIPAGAARRKPQRVAKRPTLEQESRRRSRDAKRQGRNRRGQFKR